MLLNFYKIKNYLNKGLVLNNVLIAVLVPKWLTGSPAKRVPSGAWVQIPSRTYTLFLLFAIFIKYYFNNILTILLSY